MLENNSKNNRQKLYDEYEDSLFKLVMHDAAQKEGRLLNEENEKIKDNPEYVPSQAKIEKFNKQLKTYHRRHMTYGNKRRIKKN